MPTDKIRIANLALTKIGSKIIKSFSEDSAEARAVAAVYDEVRDEVLGEHPWSFAQKRVALTTLAITPIQVNDEMSIVYSKPNDLIKVNFISDSTATFKVEQDGILSDTGSLKIIYTYRNDDPSKYFPLFTTALASRLACELCFALSESRVKAGDLFEEYEKIRLPRAVAMDSQQGTPVQMIQNEWENYRFMAGNTMVAQPGQQTWHPVW